MLSANQKITLRQLQLLILLDAFGTAIITLPRRTAEYAAQDGWLIVLGLTAYALVCTALITAVTRRFPSASFMTYTRRLLTAPVAYVLGLGLAVKLLLNASVEMHMFGLITQQTLLPSTPMPVTCVALVATGAYTAAKGIETRARVAELLYLAVLLPLAALFILSLFDSDWHNLTPVLVTPPLRLAEGTFHLGGAFAGLESLLLVFPFIKRPVKGRRAAFKAVALTGFIWLLLTATATAKFGPDDLQAQPWPVLRLMDMLNIPGSFIERQDALVLSIWIISVFAAINAALFFGAVLLKDIFKRGHHGVYVLAAAVVVWGLSCLPLDRAQTQHIADVAYRTLGIFYLLILPVVLLTVAWLRDIGQKAGETS